MRRVMWSDKDAGGTFFIIAEEPTPGVWEFFTQRSHEIRCYPLASTPELVAHAELEWSQRNPPEESAGG